MAVIERYGGTMPHINAIVTNEATMLLQPNKEKMRGIIHKLFGYPMEQIALIPRVLSEQEQYLADNILPIELVIDLGRLPNHNLGDRYAERYRDELIKKCPSFRAITFGVWIREMQSNGFAAHTPA